MAHTDLPDRMREAAETLGEASALYGFNPDWGVWNPVSLRTEAAQIESETPQ